MFRISILMSALLLCAAVGSFADLTINQVHQENGLTCADCHGKDSPERRASAKTCNNCHDAVPGSIKEYDDAGNPRTVNVHDSHDGQLRCTLCHHIHEASELYCNGCHYFDVSVP